MVALVRLTTLGSLLLNSVCFVAFIAATLSVSGCSKKARPYSAKEAVGALAAQSDQVKTVRGRAWVTSKTEQQKLSFAAVVAIDRTDAKHPELRIEAIDPVGSTHGLAIMKHLGHHLKFTWVDFDNQTITDYVDKWRGIPLSSLADLLLGVARLPENGQVSAATADGFEVSANAARSLYLMEWIDPGPRLALSAISSELVTETERLESQQARGLPAEKYNVTYSQFTDTKDFYLPRHSQLFGLKGSTPLLEVELDWRERTWNEEIPKKVFELPKARLEKFEHIQ